MDMAQNTYHCLHATPKYPISTAISYYLISWYNHQLYRWLYIIIFLMKYTIQQTVICKTLLSFALSSSSSKYEKIKRIRNRTIVFLKFDITLRTEQIDRYLIFNAQSTKTVISGRRTDQKNKNKKSTLRRCSLGLTWSCGTHVCLLKRGGLVAW